MLVSLQEDDECAKKVRLTYGSMKSSWVSVREPQIEFNVRVPQGQQITLTIILKLITNTNVLFWEKTHITSIGECVSNVAAILNPKHKNSVVGQA